MKTFYRLERIDPETSEPMAASMGDSTDGWGRRITFEHEDYEVVQHWIFHERMHQPEAEFRVTLVTEDAVNSA